MNHQLSEDNKHRFCKEALALKQEIEVDFLALGAMLSKIQKERYFEAGWGSWEEYSMELKISPSTISRLINIYEVFAVRFNNPNETIAEAGGWSVVAEYLPLVSDTTTSKDVVEWLGTVSGMTRADVRKTIVEAKTGVEMAKCEHRDTYQIKICRECGDRWEI